MCFRQKEDTVFVQLMFVFFQVLSKFPLVQHIVFGSLFSLKPAESGASIRRAGLSTLSNTRLSESSFSYPPGSLSSVSKRSEDI